MELGMLSGVNPQNYMDNQNKRSNVFEMNNNNQLGNFLNEHPYEKKIANNQGFAEHQTSNISNPLYAPEYVNHQQQVLSGQNYSFQGGNNNQQNARRQMNQDEGFANYTESNNPTNETLLDLNKRPMTDFMHNNMVPFYGSKMTQNMAGTGVSSGSYTDSTGNGPKDVNSGFDDTTPFQSKLNNFTGLDDTQLNKRETGPMFSPAEQQTGWVYGMPLIRPDASNYTQGLSKSRNDLSPVEKIQVGPGLNLDPDIPANGGFHEFTRILPNNVSDYKANQLSGRVIEGKHFAAELPTSYVGIGTSLDETAPGVVKNKPNSFYDQVRYPTMTTKVAFQNNFEYNRSDYQADFKPGNSKRDQISFGLGNLEYKNQKNQKNDTVCVNEEVSIGQGPIGSRIPLTGQRSETFMSIDHNVRSKGDCSSLPIGNPQQSTGGFTNILSNWYVNETDRGQVNPSQVMPNMQSTATQGSTFWTYTDEARTTTKDTTNVAYIGNTKGTEQSKFYTYDDLPKTRTIETTEFSYIPNAVKEKSSITKFWTYEDEVPTTTRETTLFSHTGGGGIPGLAETNRSMWE